MYKTGKQALSSGHVVPTEQEIEEGGLSNTDKRNRGCCRKAWTAAKIRVPKLCSNKLSWQLQRAYDTGLHTAAKANNYIRWLCLHNRLTLATTQLT